jgi:pimeloyl-ACP methyl ester carboxylesterase
MSKTVYFMLILTSLLVEPVLGQTERKEGSPSAAESVAQAPRLPLPYTQQEVIYPGGATGVTLAATLYLPAGVKKPPVAILVPGTGRQDRTSTMGRHPYYNVIVDHLCRHGVAVLWADDRGVGKSTGSFDSATTTDFAHDVIAGVKFLQTVKQIDRRHIGIIGHSEGGTMASIATANCADVAFLVSLAGVAIDGLQSVTLQNEGIVNQSPITPDEMTAYNSLNRRLFRIIHDHVDDPRVDTLMMREFRAWKKEQSTALLHKMRFDDYIGDRYIGRFLVLPQAPWYRHMIMLDPSADIRRLRVPVLALNGDRDVMVDADSNLQAFRINLVGNADHTEGKMPGLNHMFQHCETCTQQEYTQLAETISPEVLNIVSDWIIQRTR